MRLGPTIFGLLLLGLASWQFFEAIAKGRIRSHGYDVYRSRQKGPYWFGIVIYAAVFIGGIYLLVAQPQ